MRSRGISMYVLPLLVLSSQGQGQQDGFRAVVFPDSAEFVFPVPGSRSYRWQLDESPVGQLEYRWSVTVGDGAKADLGFFVFKQPTATGVIDGTLDELLEDGQATLWKVADRGTMTADTTVRLRVRSTGARIALSISDSATIRRLFGHRPDSVTFHVRRPGVPPTEHRQAVEYR